VSAGFAGLLTDGIQRVQWCNADVMLVRRRGIRGATLMSCWCDVVGSVVAFLSDCQQVSIPVNVLVAAEQDRIKQERRNTHCGTLPLGPDRRRWLEIKFKRGRTETKLLQSLAGKCVFKVVANE
jgi:hypothetical protein